MINNITTIIPWISNRADQIQYIKLSDWYHYEYQLKLIYQLMLVEDVLIHKNKLLGAGQYGEVYLGEYKNMKVAVNTHSIQQKYIQIKTPQDYRLLQRELQISQWLKHENIAQVYKVIKADQGTFIIMEYCNGPTLKDKIDKEQLNTQEIKKYLFQIISVMFYLSRFKKVNKEGKVEILKISHRDLKPQNMLLHNESIKIVDFGLAKVISDDVMHTFVGTANYASPQLIINGQYIPEKNDVWSFGIIAYYMLTKKLPWKNQPQLNHYNLNSYVFTQGINLQDTDANFSLDSEPIEDSLKLLISRSLAFNEEKRATFKELYEMDYFSSENKELQEWQQRQWQKLKLIKNNSEQYIELIEYELVTWIFELKQEIDTKQKQETWDLIYNEILEYCNNLPVSYFRRKYLEFQRKKSQVLKQ